MLHEPAAKAGKDPAFAYKRRLGVIMFIIYGAIYAAFVVVNVVVPQHMGDIVFAGLDIDVVYGFGLIVLALVLALFYNRACSRKEAELSGGKKGARA
jgi:uncharacterized membrane protein (DUF485 family)